jgi:hypothetical protein
MSRIGLFITTIFLAASGLCLGVIHAGLSRAPQTAGGASPEGDRREQARGVKRARVAAYPGQRKRYDRVDELARDSSAVVVGVPLFKVGHKQKETDRLVLTYYQVQVLDVLKGAAEKGKRISLRVPGGTARLKDGSLAEMTMPEFWRNPEVGKAYVFFLKEGRGANGKVAPFDLTGGPQGLFAISPWEVADPESIPVGYDPDFSTDRVVVPQVRPADELMKNYRDMPVAAFIQAVQQGAAAAQATADAAGKESTR